MRVTQFAESLAVPAQSRTEAALSPQGDHGFDWQEVGEGPSVLEEAREIGVHASSTAQEVQASRRG